jgi:hypothetical protein
MHRANGASLVSFLTNESDYSQFVKASQDGNENHYHLAECKVMIAIAVFPIRVLVWLPLSMA